MTQANGRSTILRAVPVLALALLAIGALAIRPAVAAKGLTKNKALNLFYTKGAAEAQFLNPTEGDARYHTKAAADAQFLDGAEADTRYVQDTVFYREGAPITLADTEEDLVEADCPAGTRAVGGGGYTERGEMYIESSYPTDGTDSDVTGTTAWTVWAINFSGADGDVWPYVICVRADTVDVNF